MTIPFLHYFKRKPVQEHSVVARVEKPPVEKASNERLSKTVLPNATRAPGQGDPFPIDNGRSSAGSRASSSLNPGGLPPAVALALEPKVERAITLDLADVVEQMPDNLIRPLQEADAGRRVFLKAAEIEKGMAKAKPTVSIATIFEQVPEIFLQPVPADDTRQVSLPFAKVVEQFSKLQLRSDQYREQSVPQMETPFLQVTLEDNARFGIVTPEPVQTSDLPPMYVQLATAESIAAAEPEAAMREKFSLAPPPTITPTPLRASTPAPAKPQGVPPSSDKSKSAPARIAFKITPNGTDVPAPEKVPASTGPSVPTSSPTPKRIPFHIDASSDEPRAEGEPWLTKESLDADGTVTPKSETFAPESLGNGSEAGSSQSKISLPLKPILQSLPPFQLTGDIAGVPDDARVELPFSLVEPQLITGRVTLQPEEFALALPEEYRGLFSTKDIATPVALSLQDVLKNLPTASLRIREDQESEEKGGNFATPFSAKAEEDAKRFSGTAKSVAAKVAPAVAADPAEKTEPVAPPISTPTPVVAAVTRTPLQELLETDDEVDAKAVVAHLVGITGVKACAIMFGDGLSLAGTLPQEYEADGLCALAPTLLQRLENHLVETKLGRLRAMTLSCAEGSLTFLMEGNLCLAALHAQDGLEVAVREKLARALHELSLKYSHPV